VDYDATVWVNGREVGRHRGGFSPFACDLCGVVEPGETAVIVVRARDLNKVSQPSGKQAGTYAPAGCHLHPDHGYLADRVDGAGADEAALKRPRITPDVANGLLRLEQPLTKQPARPSPACHGQGRQRRSC
jgi:hypothetical protein